MPWQVHNHQVPYKRPLRDGETGAKIQGGGHLLFGIDQDAYGDLFAVKQSLCGDLSDARLFFSLLSIDQMLDFVQCRPLTGVAKPIVDLTNLDLFNHGAYFESSVASQESICSRQSLSSILVFPEHRTFDKSARLCHASGGQLAVPVDDQENTFLINLSSEYKNECTGDYTDTVWLGLRADLETNTWLHYLTERPIIYE